MRDEVRDGGGERDPDTISLPGGRGTSSRGGRHRAAGIVIGVAILFGGTVGYLLAQAQRAPSASSAESRTTKAGAEARISVERQLAARRLGTFAAAPFDPTDPPSVILSGFVTARLFAPPFEAIDSALFDVGEERIRLARILPVGRDEVCLDGEGRRFACGLMGRATLQNLLARHEVICLPLFSPKDKRHDFIEADCRLDGVDVAEYVVRAGFAFPAALAGPRLEKALTEARDAKAGVWRGPHLVSETDRAIEDAHDIEISALRAAATAARDPDRSGPDRAEERPDFSVGSTRTDTAPARRTEEAPRPKRRPGADRADERPRPGPVTPLTRPPGLQGAPSTSPDVPRSGVVAGPILPPPDALARKLGLAPSTTGGEPGDPARGGSDR